MTLLKVLPKSWSKGLSDPNDANRLEKGMRKLFGVMNVQINVTNGKVIIDYIPTLISQNDIRKAMGALGFKALVLGGEAEDVEGKAREAEISTSAKIIHHQLDFHSSTVPFCHGK